MKSIIYDNRIKTTVKFITPLLFLFLSITGIFGKTVNNLSISQIIEINFDNFNDISELQLNGDAAQADGINGNKCLRVTPSLYTQAGSFFSKNSIPLVDPTGFNASFQAFFSFRMTDSKSSVGNDPDGPGADGIVFVVQTVANNVGGTGGQIGYKGISRSVGIEFDSWYNGENNDRNGNHIGININGSCKSLKTLKLDKRLNSGDIYFAWIDYNGTTDVLSVRFSDTPQYPSSPVLTHTIDLTSVLKQENAFVGFTSATGAACNNHDILSFRFINNARISDLINDQHFTVRESAPEGYDIGTVQINSLLENEISLAYSGLPGEFSFDTDTRHITVAENTKLNYKNRNIYTFNIEALYIDTLAESLIDIKRDTAIITIHVLSGNLIDPQSFTIKETEKEGYKVGVVSINSPKPDKVKLTPLSIPGEFKFDRSNNTIIVAPIAQFDYLRQKEYTFNMQAMFIDTLTNSLTDTLFDTALITIHILEDRVNIIEAVYSDENGDGSIDCATITLNRKPHGLPEKLYLLNPFDSSDSILVEKDDITWNEKILKINLPSPFPFSGSTVFQTDKYGRIEDSRYNDSSFKIKDGVAPVIIKADYYPDLNVHTTGPTDTLTVGFSEIINKDIEYDEPFKLISMSNGTYTFTLKQILKTDNTHTFIVEKISNDISPSVNSNDSIWIDTEAKISDLSKNYQRVRYNRKVKLNVRRGQYQFIVKPLTPFTVGKTDISNINNLKPKFLTGTVITVDFLEDAEELISDYYIRIFDPVGNTLVNSRKNDKNIDKILVTRKNKTKIYFFWNGFNANRRSVAHGSYYALVNVEIANTVLGKGFYLQVTSD